MGLISRYGLIPYAASLDTVGAMTRSVKDMSIVLENIAGYDEHDMTSCTKKYHLIINLYLQMYLI